MSAGFDQFVTDEYTQAAEPRTPYHRSKNWEKSTHTRVTVPVDEQQFHNDTVPIQTIQRQKPEHLVMIYMKAEGKTNIEIATAMECSPITVGYVLRQPWARKQLKDIIVNAGANEVVALFKGAASEAAQLLIDQLGSEDERVAQSAADKILDRAFGKANQPMSVSYSDEDLQKLTDNDLLKLASGN